MPTTVAPEPATVGPTAPEPPTPAVPTTAVPTTPPAPGPILALTESVDKKGTLASNLLPGLSAEARLAAIDIVSGGGEIVYTTPAGDYVFNAPNGRNTTVIAFTYVQGEIPVTDNTLTISTR